ncbi:MAG: hypothetical protein IT324_18160 [Anaerolineae bacterium]|nr:hypothetical protein [Anaerolineae bacterium]
MKSSRVFKRLGCGVLLVLWFTLLLTPCLAIVLATQQEIVLTHSDIPNDDFRIWLVQDAKQRGVAISNSRRVDLPDNRACTLISVSFLMWQGKGDPTSYCSCYQRQGGGWTPIDEDQAVCK